MYCDEDNKSDTSFGKNISSMIPLLYDCVKGYWKRHDSFLKKLDILIVGQALSVCLPSFENRMADSPSGCFITSTIGGALVRS